MHLYWFDGYFFDRDLTLSVEEKIDQTRKSSKTLRVEINPANLCQLLVATLDGFLFHGQRKLTARMVSMLLSYLS